MIHDDSQPLRELQWLANYFKSHGNDQMAKEIHDKVRKARKAAQSSLKEGEASDVLQFTGNDRRREEESNDIG